MKNVVWTMVMVGLLAGGAQAATYYYDVADGGGANSGRWHSQELWSSTTPAASNGVSHTPIATNDYILDGTGGGTLSTDSATSTFAGDSITVTDDTLNLRGSDIEVRTQTANYILAEGLLSMFNSNVNIAGTLAINDPGTGENAIGLSDEDQTVVSALMSGSGGLVVREQNTPGGRHSIEFTNSSNTYTGLLTIGHVSRDQALVDVEFSYSTTGLFSLELVTDATGDTGENLSRLLMDRNHSFLGVNLSGDDLAVGTYTWAQLDTLGYGGHFVDGGGSETVTVVPEPATLGLLVCGGLGLLLKRRRRVA